MLYKLYLWGRLSMIGWPCRSEMPPLQTEAAQAVEAREEEHNDPTSTRDSGGQLKVKSTTPHSPPEDPMLPAFQILLLIHTP